MKKVSIIVILSCILLFSLSSCSKNDIKWEIKSVYCGKNSTFLIDAKGEVVGFGNLAGAIMKEDGSFYIKDLSKIKSIADKDSTVFALKEDGDVFVWGNNYDDIFDIDNSIKPIKIEGLKDIESISVSDRQVLALDKEGNVFNWGNGIDGIVKKSELNNIKKGVCGDYNCLILDRMGDVYVWGSNVLGQLGDGKTSIEESYVPQQILSLKDIVDIDISNTHCIALDKDGKVYTWGGNYEGVLGYETKLDHSSEVKMVLGLDSIQKVYASSFNSYALKNDGTLWAWGENVQGQLGTGSEKRREYLPVKVEIDNVKDFAGGVFHCIALKNDGTIWVWGNGESLKSVLDLNGREFVSKPEKINMERIMK